ncbi:hypothetical protein N431DRAFT_529685 [Stipitochalara longipes BDJ]|nr:hypothetical protein N431DRAFT_529685 [Stipitochalara longipes BDJ]
MSLKKAHTFDIQTLPQLSGKALWGNVEQALMVKENTFSYKPIHHHEEIRILKIIHGAKSAAMECMLYTSPLSSAKPRLSYPYWALSYWWGDDKPSHQITMYRDTGVREGLQKFTPFHFAGSFYVRNNLASALKHFRQKDRDVDLWVDALCIDQEHGDRNGEKAAQVARMNEIYSEAENVCVWLGPGKPESKETFEFLRNILDLKFLDDQINTKANPEKWMLVINLMKNKWFSRRWVIQELALAKTATVHWGGADISWPNFADAIALFMTKHDRITEILGKPGSFMAFQNPTEHVGALDPRALGANTLVNATTNLFRRAEDGEIHQRLLTLEVLVSSLFLPFEASEPKDTIYAVLSLAKDTSPRIDPTQTPSWRIKPRYLPIDVRVSPDYDKTLTDVYADFMEYCIENSKSLDILCRHWAPLPKPMKLTPSQHFDILKAGHKAEEEKLPTWIPTVDGHAYGGPLGVLSGRKNGDSLVGGLERLNQQNYNASEDLQPYVKFGKCKGFEGTRKRNKFDGKLYVKGFRVDVIGEKLTGRVSHGVIPAEAFEYGGWISRPDDEVVPDHVPDQLWRTLVADRGPNATNAPTWYRRACLECLMHTNPNGDFNTQQFQNLPDTPVTMKSFLERVRGVIWCRKFFLTAGRVRHKPYFGLAPPGTREGDLICILFGCSVPVILRKIPNNGKGLYNFIGECYVHGIMDGEALPAQLAKRPKWPYKDVQGFTLV